MRVGLRMEGMRMIEIEGIGMEMEGMGVGMGMRMEGMGIGMERMEGLGMIDIE